MKKIDHKTLDNLTDEQTKRLQEQMDIMNKFLQNGHMTWQKWIWFITSATGLVGAGVLLATYLAKHSG